jgi:hypothetical protein
LSLNQQLVSWRQSNVTCRPSKHASVSMSIKQKFFHFSAFSLWWWWWLPFYRSTGENALQDTNANFLLRSCCIQYLLPLPLFVWCACALLPMGWPAFCRDTEMRKASTLQGLKVQTLVSRGRH